MRLTLRQIEIFLNVVEMGSLTMVAKRMDMSQSAISMSIKELESIIKRPLFDRFNKKLIPNEIGRGFYRSIEPLYRQIEDIEHEFINTKDRGSIRVGASTTIIDYILPSITCSYIDRYPEVNVELKSGNTSDILLLVKSGELDMGFVEGDVNDVDIIKEVVGSDELVVVTANRELISKSWSIEELAKFKWVLRERGSGTRDIFLNYISKRVKNLNVFMELGHTESIKSLLKHGKTLACISKMAVSDEINSGEFIMVDVKNFSCNRNFYLIYHKNKYKSELFNRFLEHAKREIDRDCCNER
jgi:DNA-binding transcriptional LysR family regulator